MIAALAAQLLPSTLVTWTAFLAVLAYIFVAMRRFCGQSVLRTGVKFVGVGAVYTILFLLPALLAVLVVSLTEA